MYKKDQLYQFVNFGESSNIYNMKNILIKEEEDKLEKFQQGRIDAFDEIENDSHLLKFDLSVSCKGLTNSQLCIL